MTMSLNCLDDARNIVVTDEVPNAERVKGQDDTLAGPELRDKNNNWSVDF